MNEDFLHYVWKSRLFDQSELRTISGEPVSIIYPGEHNRHAGPDFFNARIVIGSTTWAGNVEIHLKASDWNRHLHHEDAAYSNVILHVVLEADEEIRNGNNVIIPALELKFRILPHVQRNYSLLGSAKNEIPCGSGIKEVPPVLVYNWMERLVVERLENKSELIRKKLDAGKMNWEEAFYQVLAQNFGFKVNAAPFYQLALNLPLNIVAKHRHNLFQLEALLFGQAGMLEEEFEEKYPRDLQNEYAFLKHKYSLQPMKKEAWKFMRMRPGNFPTIRIAEFAGLLHASPFLFSKATGIKNLEALQAAFTAAVSAYWKTHYVFGKAGKSREKSTGAASVNIILINTVIPFLFVYGKEKQADEYCERAIDFLGKLPAEENFISRKYRDLGVSFSSALQSQGLIQLFNNYCTKKQCLQCAVAANLLSKNSEAAMAVAEK